MSFIETSTPYRLKTVISVYERRNHDALKLQYYLEKHDVAPIKDTGYKILPGEPLTEQALFGLGSFLRSRDKGIKMRRGLLPDTLMYIDSEYQTYVWHRHEHVGKIIFDDTVKFESGRFVHPHLLFKATANTLRVYVIKDKKPRLDTPLYHPPYLNMYDDNTICKGTIDTERLHAADTHVEFMRAWETLFFESKFSAGLGVPTDFGKMLASNRKSRVFNYRPLIKTDECLEDILPS